MKVSDLKEKLQDILDNLSDYDDDEEIAVEPNTYFLRNKSCFLGTYNGYIDLTDPVDRDY